MCGRYYSEGIKPVSFSGWVRPVNVRGFTALDIGSNARRVERTYQDVRRDGADHFFALFPARGQLAMFQNDQAVQFAVGDVALVDAARPVTYSAENGEQWNTVSLSLPSVASFLPRIRTKGRSLPARRNACGTPALRAHSDLRQ
jgi:AraC family transcriptional regulator, positive regulator of tynA and feaB